MQHSHPQPCVSFVVAGCRPYPSLSDIYSRLFLWCAYCRKASNEDCNLAPLVGRLLYNLHYSLFCSGEYWRLTPPTNGVF